MTDMTFPGLDRQGSETVKLLRDAALPLPDPDAEQDFGTLFDRFAGARVVLLGEATHGSSEFYRARAAITRRLIERHGFSIVIVEADWPDANRIDRYVRHRGPGQYDKDSFARFPTWMWRNEEVGAFVTWMRQHNEALPMEQRAEFRGLDVYSLHASVQAVLTYLDRVDPAAAAIARKRYGCLSAWHMDPAWYGRAVLRGTHDSCEDAVVAQLKTMLDRELDATAKDGEDLFDAVQNARIVRAAETYYRIMYRGSTESWNLRDRHMFETLQYVMKARGPETKAVVWAHNSHIGNAAATVMGWQGEFNIGEFCKTAYGDDAVSIGFGTDRGTVAAADDWDGPMRIKNVLPARLDSYEYLFLKAGMPRSLTELRGHGRGALREALTQSRLERAIGVIYRPDTEFHSHYFEAVLPDQFDAYVWFEETKAVTPLPSSRPHGVPETYPFGV
ncbi:erythromycin esterase family protein [Beijerinckia indica]|uniref:Erythromycin esterase n=1 Tax=Beijerinckia indica subsp. indica (strain ATCC 9039 / DSM 1715 / NCIMB 8712) TaxID=395963 RepID=B2II02_BEII9|nr:erythromycin esterase family protein [Beijerinckia indica]ACB94585.1 Erythromycin esterase [Beijerinckia indica subsp. indica ATCC 9039]